MIISDKKIVAFDLDGTLTESKQHLEPDMSRVLCDLAKQKMVVVISGGSYNQFQKQFLPFFRPNPDEEVAIYKNLFLLPTSGSQRYEYNAEKNEWEMTDEEPLPEETRKRVIEIMQEIIDSGRYDIAPAIEGDDIIEDRRTQVTMSALGQHAPIDKKMLWDPNQRKRQKIKAEIESKISDVSVIVGGSTSVDVLQKDFSKATGLVRLINKIDMSIDDMVFVGDGIFPGGNDYSAYEAGIDCVKVAGPEETLGVIKEWL